MTEQSLTEALRESIAARKTATPEQYKLDLLARELPEIKKALAGANYLLNLAVANSREVAAENHALKIQVDLLQRTVADLKAAIGEQQLLIEKNAERLDGMAKWAAGKDKQ